MSDEQQRELELAWEAKALMAICDQTETWQAGDGSIYDPVIVKVSDAARVIGRLVAAELERRDHGGYVRIKLDDARRIIADELLATMFGSNPRVQAERRAEAVVAALREAAQ